MKKLISMVIILMICVLVFGCINNNPYVTPVDNPYHNITGKTTYNVTSTNHTTLKNITPVDKVVAVSKTITPIRLKILGDTDIQKKYITNICTNDSIKPYMKTQNFSVCTSSDIDCKNYTYTELCRVI